MTAGSPRAGAPEGALRPSPAVYVKLLLTAVFWGGTFVAAKVAARDVGPYSAAFLRFSIASVFLWFAVARLEGRTPRPTARQLVPCLLLGMTGVFGYNVFFFKGLKLIEAGRAAIIIANNPIGIALCSALVFGERLGGVRLAGILTSVVGAVTVISRGDPRALLEGGVGWGEVFILGCVASWVLFSLLGKRFMKDMTPLDAVFFASISGALCLLPPALFEGLARNWQAIPALAWACLLYLGFFGTVLGFVWYYEGIKTIGATRAGVFINFVPVSGILFGHLILDEPVTGSLAAGTLLVLGGVWLTNRPETPRAARAVTG